jgi:ferredoxin
MKAELRFNDKIVDKPIISIITLRMKSPINILWASINDKGGKVLVEVPDDEAGAILKAFEEEGVEVIKRLLIEVNEKCMSCGHCVTLCPTNVLFLDESSTLKVDADKCVQCGRCVDACPVRAIVLSI